MTDEAKQLPPDPDGMNNDRATWAESAIVEFEAATGSERENSLSDMLCDLMHWCDRNGQSFDFELFRARDYYAAETQAEG